jgi:hypothetical protein
MRGGPRATARPHLKTSLRVTLLTVLLTLTTLTAGIIGRHMESK